ncbi:MAG: helix-turn-helix domain-containing protein [Nanoarchaeota archaeon]|nr:helix-turn-helix domain-containing protein [Nanoarchaeota archaeon]MBU1622511.1 helix-turn-helix domain-containing protein [Nanoarchaeota archaeon]
MAKKITLIKIRRGSSDNVNRELQWIGNSLGLFNLRDKDSSCFRVFITLVRRAKNNKAVSSDEIAARLSLTRGTVVHHLTKLMDSGLVVREREGYLLRERDLSAVINDMKRDMEAMFAELNEVAREIDEKLG